MWVREFFPVTTLLFVREEQLGGKICWWSWMSDVDLGPWACNIRGKGVASVIFPFWEVVHA